MKKVTKKSVENINWRNVVDKVTEELDYDIWKSIFCKKCLEISEEEAEEIINDLCEVAKKAAFK